MNKMARSRRREDVRSFAREHAWKPRRGSSVHTLIPRGPSVKRGLLEQVEAENARLRGSVVDLMLEIQALRDGARTQKNKAALTGSTYTSARLRAEARSVGQS